VSTYMNEQIRRLVAENFLTPTDTNGNLIPGFEVKLNQLVDSVLHYAEVWDATGRNTLGLVDAVIATYDFLEDPEWFTIDKGMTRLMEALKNALAANTLRSGVQVLGIARNEHDQRVKVSYSPVGSHSPTTDLFDAVLVTAPFGSVRLMDFSGMGFSYGKQQAIRTLQYDQYTKIFVQFPKRWWDDSCLQGGASRTDLPVRTITYLSNNDSLPAENKHVLLASYTRANEAVVWGNTDRHTIKEIVVRDLNSLHGTSITLTVLSPSNFSISHTVSLSRL